MNCGADISGRRMALIVVDMQRKYAYGRMEDAVTAMLPSINGAMELFRSHGLPVAVVRMAGSCHPVPDDLGDPEGFVDGLLIDDADPVIDKAYLDAFHGTPLADILAEAGTDTVVVCGLVSDWCVMATYFGAYNAGLSPFLLEGGSASTCAERTAHAEAICKTLSLGDLRTNLEPAERGPFIGPQYGQGHEGLRGL